jgi:crotonobetainyl-CoA:carnitine CoA-transferase CaiB-like acyl-CoA transferase
MIPTGVASLSCTVDTRLALPFALNGVMVPSVAGYVTIRCAGRLLGDMGAEVIKAEKREGGDPLRGFPRCAWRDGYDTGLVAFDR